MAYASIGLDLHPAPGVLPVHTYVHCHGTEYTVSFTQGATSCMFMGTVEEIFAALTQGCVKLRVKEEQVAEEAILDELEAAKVDDMERRSVS